MQNKRKKFKGARTPEQLMADGFQLKPIRPKGIPRNTAMIHQEFGSDGKLYSKIRRMTKREQRFHNHYEKMTKQGNQVWFRYEPLNLLFSFPYNLDVKKDSHGNVTVIITKEKK